METGDRQPEWLFYSIDGRLEVCDMPETKTKPPPILPKVHAAAADLTKAVLKPPNRQGQRNGC